MVVALRRFAAVLASVGFVASVNVYAASFFRLSPGEDRDVSGWVLPFFAGVVLLYVPNVVIEYDGMRADRKLYWQRYVALRPYWAWPSVQISGIFAAIHFMVFLVLTRASSPGIVDGQYVLDDHGTVRSVISQAEYLSLKAWEMRFMASFWICLYLFLAIYWWYPSARVKPGAYES